MTDLIRWGELLIRFVSQSFPLLPTHSRCRGSLHLITLRHTLQLVGLLWTRDRPVAETSTWQYNTHKRRTSMPPVGFEPKIPASARPQTHARDRAVTGIGGELLIPRVHEYGVLCRQAQMFRRSLMLPSSRGLRKVRHNEANNMADWKDGR
jgi:hypothetical protein